MEQFLRLPHPCAFCKGGNWGPEWNGMLVVGICDFPPIEMHDGWGSLQEVVVDGKGGPAPAVILKSALSS